MSRKARNLLRTAKIQICVSARSYLHLRVCSVDATISGPRELYYFQFVLSKNLTYQLNRGRPARLFGLEPFRWFFFFNSNGSANLLFSKVCMCNRKFSIFKFAYQFQSKNSILDHVMHNFKATSKILLVFFLRFFFLSYQYMACRSLVAIDYNLKVISHMRNVEEVFFFLSVQEEHTYTKAPFD